MNGLIELDHYFQHRDSSTSSLAKLQDDSSIAQALCQPRYNPDLGSDSDESSQASYESFSSQGSTFGSSSPSSYGSDDATNVWVSSPTVSEFSDSGSIHTRKISPPAQISACELQRFQHEVPFRIKSQNLPSLSQALSQHDSITAGPTEVDQSAAGLRLSSDQNTNRRRGRSIGNALPPPQLRRDTDHTEAIVRMIVLFCTNLINSIWCVKKTTEAEIASSQPGSNVLPLRIFITETLRRSKTSYSTLQIALYYLILLKQCLPASASSSSAGHTGCRAMQCGRRMFLTSLILASKYLQDRNYSARAWSKISGLPLKEINDNERRFLSIVSWDLHVPKATFENWSKIVLNVCRRSIDSSGCKEGTDRASSNLSPGASPQRHCGLSFTCNDIHALWNWWKVTLQKLRTDIVKCPLQTQHYVESIAPFRDGPYLPRPVFEQALEDEYDSRFLQSGVVANEERPRPQSLDRSTQRFEPVPDLLHPAPALTIPQQPMLTNLPTPQATPQTNVSNWWTPKVGGNYNKPSLRCRASASALGNAFRKHCPVANLENCPPPKPRSFDQSHSAYSQYAFAGCSFSGRDSASLASSPESIASDVSFFQTRSRSSSISSTSSSNTSQCVSLGLTSGVRRQELDSMASQLAMLQQQQIMSRSAATSSPICPQPENRPKTAFKVPSDSTPRSISTDVDAVKQVASNNRKDEQALLGLRIDTSVVDSGAVRSRARGKPGLARTQTQIFKPCRQEDPKQILKRNRSESTDLSHGNQSHIPPRWRCVPSMASADATTTTLAVDSDTRSAAKEVHMPDQQWAAPRRPIQRFDSGKRMAIQTPMPNHHPGMAAIDMPWFNL